jgi:PKD repeat protein
MDRIATSLRGLVAICAAGVLFAPSFASAAPPVVRTVPWVASNPLIPHDTWSGKIIRLKGTTDVQGATFQYSWDFGDGSPATAFATVTNRYALEASHAYVGADDTIYTAVLTVRNTGTGEQTTKNYFVAVRAKTLEVEVNVAIDEGLWYLHKNMTRGALGIGSGNIVACPEPCGTWWPMSGWNTVDAVNLNAFQVNGHLEDGAVDNPYTETVKRGMRSLMAKITTVAIPATKANPAGTYNPDTNGNGYGALVNQADPFYQSGPIMDAIAASGTPLKTAEVGKAASGADPGIVGRTYLSIIQDMVDYLAACQYAPGAPWSGAGGWRYSCNDFPDSSAAQWAAIGTLGAQAFGATIPAQMKTSNRDFWNVLAQNATTGVFGYTNSSPLWGPYATTPSGMVQLAMTGIGRGNSRWDKAETFLRDNFHLDSSGAGNEIKDYYYGMFALVKSMLLHDDDAVGAPGHGAPDPLTLLQSSTAGVSAMDWYHAERNMAMPESVNNTNGIARTLINEQTTSGASWGGWFGNYFTSTTEVFHTGWAIIMLNRTLFSGGAPVAVISATPNPAVAFQTIHLSGAGSFHQDPTKSIVLWEWDFDNDGQYDDATGPNPTVSFNAVGSYLIQLRVTDNAGTPAADTGALNIVVDVPPLAPTANAGGPYNFCQAPGIKYFLDGSFSSNPDDGQSEIGAPPDQITSYAWDLDNDGAFDDAMGATPDVTANFPALGSFLVNLRVADNTAASFPSSMQPNLTDTDSAQLFVRAATDPLCACSTTTARAKPGEVQVNWTAKAGAAGYNVYRSTVNGGPYTLIAQPSSATLGYLDRPLANNVTYYYVVRGRDLSGNETCQSNQASARPAAR